MTKSLQISPEVAPRRRGNLLQWNIATLLLLMAAVGGWSSYFHLKSETERMDAELDSLRQLARELVISDPNQYAIVERHEEWEGDDTWDVHLPEGNRFVLKLATRAVGKEGYPETEHFADVPAGERVISLEKTVVGEKLSARVIVDGEPVVNISESDDWNPGGGYGWGGGYKRSTQAPLEKPLELIRIRFHKPSTRGTDQPDKPYNGLFLWIERK